MNTPANSRNNINSSSYPLITKERTQKLDLLKHLIANLTHSVVICGPEGIGKSQLLKIFQQSTAQSCLVCGVQGSTKLKFADIQDSLITTISNSLPDLKSQSLATALDRIHSRGAKVVLVTDDAGFLVPGLIEKIIAYSNEHPALRVVLALTHNELYLKSTTDPALEDCYLVEVPPFSQQQCEDYLEFLSTLPRARIDFNAINEDKIAEVFRETHGVPGRILAALPEPVVKKSIDYSNPILLVSVLGLILLALGIQWWSSHRQVEAASVQPPQKHEVDHSAPAKSTTVVSSPPNPTETKPAIAIEDASKEIPAVTQKPESTPSTDATLAPAANVNQQPTVQTTTSMPRAGEVKLPEQAATINTSTNQPNIENQEIATQNNTEPSVNLGAGNHWLTAQPSGNYTLQLMALSKEDVILQVLQRYPELGDDLRYIKTKTRRGNDRFILFYGSFSDPELIKAEKQKLPKELQKIWVRKIADLQKEINRTDEVQTQTD